MQFIRVAGNRNSSSALTKNLDPPMTLSPLWHTLLKNVNITVRYQSTLYTAINYIINTVYVWAWDRNNQNITMTPASFALFTTELSNVMYIYWHDHSWRHISITLLQIFMYTRKTKCVRHVFDSNVVQF